MLKKPHNTPQPIQTNTSNAFAHNTMTNRVPQIITDIIENNPDYTDSIKADLESLRESIINDAHIPMLDNLAPDFDSWKPLFDIHKDATWLNTVWFFAETFMYRQVIEATRWWETRRDPFAPNKDKEYNSEALWELLDQAFEIDDNPDERLTQLLKLSMWGNRIDLSFEASMQHGTMTNDDDLLVDDTDQTIRQIMDGDGSVHLIADNAGTELTMDLMVIDAVLKQVNDAPIVLHLKMHPTFVSDATPTDVMHFLDILDERGGEHGKLAARLREALYAKRLRLLPHLFWNSGYFLWDLPAHLVRVFESARLVIIKGDANYRRMLGDALWQPETPFADATEYFTAPLLALRTLKSDPIVGLPPGMADRLAQADDEWRVNGQRGVIQFKGGTT